MGSGSKYLALPSSLWFDAAICLPPSLVQAYKEALEVRAIFDLACDTTERSGPTGGCGTAETLEHFARRYGVSVARVESLLLDPECALGSVAEDLLHTFADGTVSILDAPCGAGAAGLALVTTLAELRARGAIPYLPLSVRITGGDVSHSALELYQELVTRLKPHMADRGIELDLHLENWDASHPELTARLVDRWFAHSHCAEEYYAIVANFSGAAGNNFKAFERSFQHIQERLYDKTCTMVWIESGTKKANKFMSQVRKLCSTLIAWLRPIEDVLHRYQYHWFHPFQARKLPCRMLLLRYERPPIKIV